MLAHRMRTMQTADVSMQHMRTIVANYAALQKASIMQTIDVNRCVRAICIHSNATCTQYDVINTSMNFMMVPTCRVTFHFPLCSVKFSRSRATKQSSTNKRTMHQARQVTGSSCSSTGCAQVRCGWMERTYWNKEGQNLSAQGGVQGYVYAQLGLVASGKKITHPP